GETEPRLIEMQGFPTLFGFQPLLAKQYQQHFNIPENFSPFLSGIKEEEYKNKLTQTILGKHTTEETILLEIFPKKQKTRIDFYCTEDITGIKTVCLTELIKEGNKLFYISSGRKIRIKRIYNRIIFRSEEHTSELQSRENLVCRLLLEKKK